MPYEIMLKFVQYFINVICLTIRPIIKGILRRFTRLCELQRICYGLETGAPRTLAVEHSLSLSRNPALRDLLCYKKETSLRQALEGAIHLTLRIKRIKPEVHPQFTKAFGKCLEQIWGYSMLIDQIEALRQTPFDSGNPEHEKKLLLLWETLCPDVPLESRITKQWQDIGFQGDDPKTDFRGMGMLGLENLIYFSKEHISIARRILMRSLHPTLGYWFAIVGINITHLTYFLVLDCAAKAHVYNITRSPPSIRTFHHMYCYLFVEFDKFWLNSKPTNIMDFSSVRSRFERDIREKLKDNRTCLRLSVAVDSI